MTLGVKTGTRVVPTTTSVVYVRMDLGRVVVKTELCTSVETIVSTSVVTMVTKDSRPVNESVMLVMLLAAVMVELQRKSEKFSREYKGRWYLRCLLSTSKSTECGEHIEDGCRTHVDAE